jgi:hypothetical protein
MSRRSHLQDSHDDRDDDLDDELDPFEEDLLGIDDEDPDDLDADVAEVVR